VGEGLGDAAFLKHLLVDRNIDGFDVDDAGGTGKFPAYLKALPGRSGFRNLRGILVAADCDDTPDASFTEVRRALKKAGLPFPENHLGSGKGQGHSDLISSIVMLPFTTTGPTRGCLESLLLQSALERHATLATCIEPLCECVNVASWSKTSSRDKFRLRALIAAAYPDDPNYGLQYALKPDLGLIPLNHRCFDLVATAISNFKAEALR
jgi:hypothetical protein